MNFNNCIESSGKGSHQCCHCVNGSSLCFQMLHLKAAVFVHCTNTVTQRPSFARTQAFTKQFWKPNVFANEKDFFIQHIYNFQAIRSSASIVACSPEYTTSRFWCQVFLTYATNLEFGNNHDISQMIFERLPGRSFQYKRQNVCMVTTWQPSGCVDYCSGVILSSENRFPTVILSLIAIHFRRTNDFIFSCFVGRRGILKAWPQLSQALKE